MWEDKDVQNLQENNVNNMMRYMVKDRWSDGVVLEISHNGWQTTAISDLDLEDLKKLRRVIRKAIREHENN
jgi:hypothetical protein